MVEWNGNRGIFLLLSIIFHKKDFRKYKNFCLYPKHI
jgi:hypothetical protein